MYTFSVSIYGHVFVCVCPMNLCCFVYIQCMYEKMLYCSHVWMAPGKISCKLTGSPSLNSFLIELNCLQIFTLQIAESEETECKGSFKHRINGIMYEFQILC